MMRPPAQRRRILQCAPDLPYLVADTRLVRSFAGLLLVFLGGGGRASAQQTNAGSVFARCIGADTGAAWIRADSIWSSEMGTHWSNDSLRQVLLALGDSDQAVRRGPSLADSMLSPA